ncbi:sirohydrochlorin chelatase [Roseiflexus sp.]|uniref:sirohydrochlorin chelatase n=1 Tax=Roseiflexus sp. TaxID=2562120 RepID=UPI00398A712D
MRAVLLVGQGQTSSRGAPLIRLAARCRTAAIAPIVTACFLRHQRPSFAEAFAQCAAQGAQEAVVIPYVLSLTEPDRGELERCVEQAHQTFPQIAIHITPPVGDHPILAQVLMQRAIEADYIAAHHIQIQQQRLDWPAWQQQHVVGLLIVVDRLTDIPATLQREVLTFCHRVERYSGVHFCAIDRDNPDLLSPLEALMANECRWVVIAPYALEMSVLLIDAIEQAVAGTRARRPDVTVIQAEHLAYDRRLIEAIAERARVPR